MVKRKGIGKIVSALVMLVFLFASFFIPSTKETTRLAHADATGTTPIYAFVSSYGKNSGNGKVYVDIGLSLDMLDGEKITRDDATATMQARLKSFESATIYYRTRNVSAIAEEGDYEALEGTIMVWWNSPYRTVSVNINGNSGLQIGEVAREFYVEIYKVEINGVKDGYVFKNPNETPKQSRETFSISPELTLKKTEQKAVDGGTLAFMDEFRVLTSSLDGAKCSDVKRFSSFETMQVNLSELGEDWHRKLKYLSDRDLLKLGVQVTGEVEQTHYAWLYIDDCYVGIQLFAGDASNMGSPNLPDVPESNIYSSDPSVEEYARWYLKLESDAKEDISLSNAFNGTFIDLTVNTKFKNEILVANKIHNNKDGSGGIYDEHTDVVDQNIIVIDDLDGILQGQTVLSARGWAYDTKEVVEFNRFNAKYAPINYRARIESTTLGSLFYDQNGKAKIGLSVRFNEPVQLKKDTGKTDSPYIEAEANGFTQTPLRFAYAAGDGTDTFYFEADASQLNTQVSSIQLLTAKNFHLVYDFSPWTEGILGGNQALNMMETSTVVSGWNKFEEQSLSCWYDLDTPVLGFSGKASNMVKTAHSVTLQTSHVSETGMLYYGWVLNDTDIPEHLSNTPISGLGFQTVYSPADISGTRYLYAYAVSELGKKSEEIYVGPYHFDNDAPTITAKCVSDTYLAKTFELTISNKSSDIEAFTQYANLKKTVTAIVSSDYQGQNILDTFPISIADDLVNQEEITLDGDDAFVLEASELGMQEGSELEFGTYYVSFSVSDVLENQYKSEAVDYDFDVRTILRVQPVKDASDPDFEMDEFKSGGALYGTLDKNYYTLDLSKMDNVTNFYFKFKVEGANENDSSVSLQVHSFENVSTKESIRSCISDESANFLGKVKITKKFDPGLYCLIFADASSSKTSVPVYFYVTNGKNAETSQYGEETGVYKSVGTGATLTNEVFQLPTTTYFHYLKDTGERVKESYGKTNKPVTFSSWIHAYDYIMYCEYMDMYAVTLTKNVASSLNSGISSNYRKAPGDMDKTAVAGQVWIRYKDVNWNPNGTMSAWVYYYYGESTACLPINLSAISDDLLIAAGTVAGSICSDGRMVDLVTQEHLDAYGAPTISEGQLHVQPESCSKSEKNGTVFAEPVNYLGDPGIYLVIDPNASLSTNTLAQGSEYSRLFYKTDSSEYHELIWDERKTLGEYLKATGRFTILELDENGAREYYVYIDKAAPELKISWNAKDGRKEQDFTEANNNQTISGNNFYLESIEDYDGYAYVAIYRYTSQGEGDLLSVYRKRDFDNGIGVPIENDGKYHIYVSDRSGNSFSFVLQKKSDPLVCTVKEVENSHLQVEINRDEAEVLYQVYLDGWIYTTDFSTKKFTASGDYKFVIEDIYGNFYEYGIEFDRKVAVKWSYLSSDNSFVEYTSDQEEMTLTEVEEKNYIISTSTRLRFTLASGCAYEVISGTPSLSTNTSAGWVTFNNVTSFAIKIYYEKYPETYAIYTCDVDNYAPRVSVSYQKGEYMHSERNEIIEIFNANGFAEGETNFAPSFIGFERNNKEHDTTIYVSNGERVKSQYYRVQVSDESGVKLVQIYLNGELISSKTSDFHNIYLSGRGKYEIVATDTFGNTSKFTFTNDSYNHVEYFVDGEVQSTDVSFIDQFEDGVYKKVEYGASQAEIRLVSSAEVHYLITEENGTQHHVAFLVENGSVYAYKYVINVVKEENVLLIQTIDKIEKEALKAGQIAEMQDLGVAIFLERGLDQAVSLIVRSLNDEYKTYTVETRITTDKNEMPYYFKTKISNVPSLIVLTDENGDALESGTTVKVNEAFKVQNKFSKDVVSVEIAYSQTGSYTTYELLYDGNSYLGDGSTFSKEGMYHVRVLNVYGVQTDYYILLSQKLVVTATVEYARDGMRVEYSMAYVAEHDKFYSNKSVEFVVHATNLTTLEKSEGISSYTTEQGYTIFYVDKPQDKDYVLKLEDEYGNVFEKRISIKAEEDLELNGNVLTNFNEDALRRNENYTNQHVYINKDAAINGNGIVFISMTRGDQAVILYDELHEEQTSFVDDQFVGSLGDGDYVLVFRDRYGNKAETTVHYRSQSTLTIFRKTLNSMSAEEYPLDKIEDEGVWTNDSVSFSIAASQYILKVDDLENVLSIHYDSKTKNEYSVSYLDEYGFQYTFKVYMLREDVVIEPMAEMKVSMIADVLVTKDSVCMEFSENATCTYVLNNADEQAYHSGDVLYKDGVYRFKAVDKAGNVSTYVVKKDSAVEYHFEDDKSLQALINGEVVNGRSVRFYVDNDDSAYIKKVFHNNELVKHDGNLFTERGKWEVIVADDVGNESYFRFYILYGKMSGFTYTVPYDYEIESVTWQMGTSSAPADDTIKNSRKLLEATDNGTYIVTIAIIDSETGIKQDVKTFTFTIDKTPPKVELVGCEVDEKTINNVTIKGCSVGDTIYVYKGNKLVKTVYMDSELRAAPTIKEGGKYRIVVENEAGIRTELTFERKHIPNAAGSILIITVSLTLVVGLLLGLIWRNHSKTDD